MRFPKVIKHRKAEVTIYGKKKSYPFYRISYRIDGKRRMKTFGIYSDAKKAADKLVREISQGSPVAALTPTQARDAITAFERLQSLYVSTGRSVSLLAAVSEFAEVSGKLNGRTLNEVVDGYNKSVASVQRKDVSQGVEEFIAGRKSLTSAFVAKPL